jgi:hypothetical protein
MEGYIQLPKRVLSDALYILQLDKRLYVLIYAKKYNGNQYIRHLSIQHEKPEKE